MAIPDTHLAVVTGTTSGIGEAVARLLSERGWRVVGLARRDPTIESPNYSHARVDLGNAEGVCAAFAASVAPLAQAASLLRLALVNNAADAALYGQLSDVEPADMLQAFAVNSVAPVLLMRLVVGIVTPSTAVRIVNVSTGAARTGAPGLGTYAMTKAALRLAGMVMAQELKLSAAQAPRPDVSILSCEPGAVDTPMQLAVRSASPSRLPIVGMFERLKATGSLVAPEVPAKAIVSYVESDYHAAFKELEFRA